VNNSVNNTMIASNISELHGKKILVYGAGLNFNKLVQSYQCFMDLDIVAIADIKFTEPSEYMGIKAIPTADILKCDFDLILISTSHNEPIIEMLKYQFHIKKDIYILKNNSLVQLKNETDSEKTISLLYEILTSIRELSAEPAPEKFKKYIYEFTPGYMRKKHAAEQTLEYITQNASNALLLTNEEVLQHCMKYFLNEGKNIQGLFLEFGVFKGKSINFYSSLLPEQKFYGFDSFEGLPEDWGGWCIKKEKFDLKKELPRVNKNVELIPGWFDETLPAFLEKHTENVAFLHVDCDVYSSAKTIFKYLGSRIQPGTIIVFDEYFNYPGWQEHEYKVFQEFVRENNIKYEYIAIGHIQQLAVKIL
jgi:hypothetical protein